MNSFPLSAAEQGFTLLATGVSHGTDARYDETLLTLALEQPVAAIWQAPRSLVVPRSYRRFDSFDTVCEHYAAQGWPIVVRQTGGGIVPQGPGIINLSLAYPVQGPAMRHSEAGYRLICDILAQALGTLGVDARACAVEGSFCDGRYNLAVELNDEMVKVAGTAQMWRRVPGAAGNPASGSIETHAGLVHALVLLDADTQALTEAANGFEAALGSGRRYLSERVVAISKLLGQPAGLNGQFLQALESAVTKACPPGC